MISDVSLLAAFLVGLLGGVHCVGMCGGIVGVLSLGLPEQQRRGAARWKYLLAYNLARIGSYTSAGALLGGIGWLAANWSGLHQLQQGLQLLAALFMVALGLYLGGWWRTVTRGACRWPGMEQAGAAWAPFSSGEDSGSGLFAGADLGLVALRTGLQCSGLVHIDR